MYICFDIKWPADKFKNLLTVPIFFIFKKHPVGFQFFYCWCKHLFKKKANVNRSIDCVSFQSPDYSENCETDISF